MKSKVPIVNSLKSTILITTRLVTLTSLKKCKKLMISFMMTKKDQPMTNSALPLLNKVLVNQVATHLKVALVSAKMST